MTKTHAYPDPRNIMTEELPGYNRSFGLKQFWLSMALVLMGLCSLPAQSQQILFTPAQGFSGQSHGEGSLKMFFGKQRRFQVCSLGQLQPDGTMRLDQTVIFEAKPPMQRYWLIRETVPLHYQGTLSDASGPVKGQTIGNQLSLRYRVHGIFVMRQTLELSPDGKTINNSGRITFLGIPVGSLHEIIRRPDQSIMPNNSFKPKPLRVSV